MPPNAPHILKLLQPHQEGMVVYQCMGVYEPMYGWVITWLYFILRQEQI